MTTSVIEVDEAAEEAEQLRAARERFVREVPGAEMSILRNEGPYRHLVISFPSSTWERCEVVTWPGALVLRGGLGHWMFAVDGVDVLAVFRSVDPDPAYWAQKLVAHGTGDDQPQEYLPARAAAYVRAYADGQMRRWPDLAEEISETVEKVVFTDSWWRTGGMPGSEAELREAVARVEERLHEQIEEFRFPIEDWRLQGTTAWFALACVVLGWTAGTHAAACEGTG
jgi:hypothetical protein